MSLASRSKNTNAISKSQSFATNALLNQFSGGHGKPQGNNSHGSGGIGGIAGQLIGGLGGSHGSSHGSSSGGHGGGTPGLVGQLASNLFSSGNKPQQAQPQNYHGGQSHQPQHSSGLAGSVMGGVASVFGGTHGNQGVCWPPTTVTRKSANIF